MFNLPIEKSKTGKEYLKFNGDFKNLKKQGFTFRKYYARNYKGYTTPEFPTDKTYKIIIWVAGRDINIQKSEDYSVEIYKYVKDYITGLTAGSDIQMFMDFEVDTDINTIRKLTSHSDFDSSSLTKHKITLSVPTLIRTYYKIGKILGIDQSEIKAKLDTCFYHKYTSMMPPRKDRTNFIID
jgi:hypothetical protein